MNPKESLIEDRVPSLVQQSLNVCLDFWRKYFVNPSASCRMKWPGALIIFEVIKRSQNKLSIRDISGMCLTMLDADDNLSAQNWLNIIYNIHQSFASSKEYYSLVEKLCEKIPKSESKTIEDWKNYFETIEPEFAQFVPNLNWIYALRNRLLNSPALLDIITLELKSGHLEKRVVELICTFNLDALVDPLKIALESETKFWRYNKPRSVEELEKWKIAITTFPQIAEMVYDFWGCPQLKACLFEIPRSTNSKYFESLVNDPEVVAAAVSQNIVPELSTDKEYLDTLFNKIIKMKLTPNMIKLAFQISPEKILDELYNPDNAVHVCKWVKRQNVFVLNGIIDPLESFEKESIRKVIDRNWTLLKDILAPDSFPQSRSFIRGLDGNISLNTNNSRTLVDEHINAVINSESEDWRMDYVVILIYNAYQKIQMEKLSKVWNPFIEFMSKCSTVTYECFNGTPTSRSKIFITNIDVDVLSKLYPKITIQTLNDVSYDVNQDISWNKMEKSFIEYYASIHKDVFLGLQNYSERLGHFGLQLEDLAKRKATEKFREMEKTFNRQSSRKGIDFSREVKWNEILESEGKYMGSDRYRITVLVTCPEVMQHVSGLKNTFQIQHLKEIAYIFGGIDCEWACQQFFAYRCPFVPLSIQRLEMLQKIMEKCGFQFSLRVVETKTADGFQKTQKFWYAVGLYNNYYYKPTDALIEEAFVDVVYVPLSKTFINNLVKELVACASLPKIGNTLKGHIFVALKDAHTPCKNGELEKSVILKLKELVKNVTNITSSDVKEFKSSFLSLLPSMDDN